MKISFEFFPPKTSSGTKQLAHTRQRLAHLKPEYFSVTFGAGGGTRDSTLATVLDIHANDPVSAVPHISGIGNNKTNVLKLLHTYQTHQIDKLVVLRGDLPSGTQDRGEFPYAYQLVEFIRDQFDDYFTIYVAAYPETHPESPNVAQDLKHFIDKIKAGADAAITQYFYNIDAYWCFVDEINAHQITIPIIPGIMPITNYQQLVRFSKFCGAEIPKWIYNRLYDYQSDLTQLRAFGQEVVQNMCVQLKDHGVDEFHFYSMNKAEPSFSIAQTLL